MQSILSRQHPVETALQRRRCLINVLMGDDDDEAGPAPAAGPAPVSAAAAAAEVDAAAD